MEKRKKNNKFFYFLLICTDFKKYIFIYTEKNLENNLRVNNFQLSMARVEPIFNFLYLFLKHIKIKKFLIPKEKK